MRRITRRLLGVSLFVKVLAANGAVVALGAVAGTYLTTQHVRAYPDHAHVEMMLVFSVVGLALSLAINALVLRAAFTPLTQLERTARRVGSGDIYARVRLGAVSDPHSEALAVSFNRMLDTIQAHNRRLEEYSVRLQELSDQVLLAQEDERRRIARELHDQTGQELSTLLLSLRLFRDAAAQPEPNLTALRAQAAELAELARSTLDGVRTLALELRPRMLDDLGLATALRAYVDEWSARSGVPATCDAVLEDTALPATTELAVYRMVQEALTNVAKHAGATKIHVALCLRDEQPSTNNEHSRSERCVSQGVRGPGLGRSLVVEVRDNGRGIALARQPDAAAAGRPTAWAGTSSDGAARIDALPGGLSAGLGLFGAQERIALVGGRFSVESAPGAGTTVRAVIPLAERDATTGP